MFNASPTHSRAGLVTLAAIACAAAVLPGSAAASSGHAAGTSPVSDAAWHAGRAAFGANATAGEAVTAYWTPERMRAAHPVEEAPFYKAAVAKDERQAAVDKSAPKGKRPAPVVGTPFATPPAEGTAGVNAAYNPNLGYSTPTARSMGKVFFTQNGGNYVCSGTVVNTEGADTVWTAGHCVHGGAGGTWHTNWSFAPAYDDDLANPRPYGTWTANNLNAMTGWTGSSNTAEDMGVAIMNTNFGGWHIVNYFGGHGFQANQGKYVYEDAFGYPAESPFDGGNLYRCWGSSSPEWTTWYGSSSETIKIPCDMTRGSSGGAWLRSYNGSWGYINGVNSRIDRIVGPTIMLSPYFDNTAVDLFNYTRYK
ncbi:MAG: hypothetical protein QOE31_2441 [Solirubrobacteraceae bacterium]|jgi:V8-like Glu-specific endopeptidase|nr:hypothetical protein [Solirubrobacteraceae bacterium]